MPRSSDSIRRSLRATRSGAPAAAASSSLAQAAELGGSAPRCRHRVELVAQVRELMLESLPAARLVGHLEVIVLVLVGAVGEPVAGRLGVGPQPGDRPQQAAEHQRQQAQRVDRVGLRMMPLVRDLLRHHVNDPEQHDGDDRHDARARPRRCRRRRRRACRRRTSTRAPATRRRPGARPAARARGMIRRLGEAWAGARESSARVHCPLAESREL